MVVRDLDIFWAIFGPPEADAELVVDSNAVFASSRLSQLLQAIGRRATQVVKACGLIQLIELPSGYAPQEPRTRLAGRFRIPAIEDVFCPCVPEGLNHNRI